MGKVVSGTKIPFHRVNPDRTTVDKVTDLATNKNEQMSKLVNGKSRYRIVIGMVKHANPRSTDD